MPEKAITFNTADNTLTRTETTPFFTATDISGAEGEYAQVVLDAYWGSGELKVTKVSLLGQDGKVLTAAASTTAAANTTAAGNTTAAASTTAATAPDKGNANTGVEGVAFTAALAVLAGAAVIAAKKRK